MEDNKQKFEQIINESHRTMQGHFGVGVSPFLLHIMQQAVDQCTSDLASEIAELKDRLAGKWISVDTPPDDGSDVIVELGNGKIVPAKYTNGKFERYFDQLVQSHGMMDRILAITYPTVKKWQPFPTPNSLKYI